MDASSVPWNYSLPNNNVAVTMDVCEKMLAEQGIPIDPAPNYEGLWCNATYDTVLCWPPTPANTSIVLPCPPLKGLDPSKNITKHCHWSGHWLGRNDQDLGTLTGWTNYSMCYTEEVIYIMNKLNNVSLGIAQEVAKNARKLEFVGLGLSLVCLCVSIFIFTYFRRLRVFRNMLHLHLMIAILMVVVIRLILYIDLMFTGTHGPHQSPSDGKTINTMDRCAVTCTKSWQAKGSITTDKCTGLCAQAVGTCAPKVMPKFFYGIVCIIFAQISHDHATKLFTPFVCEFMYFLLEYFKTVAFGWMFLEGFVLHNQLVLTVFNTELSIKPYLLAGYGIPLLHTGVWLFVVLIKKDFKVERCLGSYYLEPEFWILDGPRMIELVVNFFFICNVIRVLWSKVTETTNSGEMVRMKKSVKAALMLIPLLGIPNIMQTIPFAPTRDNIMVFAVWTYCASFTYMYQGLMITIIYCFTNKEVISVIKGVWQRYRLQHTSQNELRRGSRSVASHYQAKNGQVTVFDSSTVTGNTTLQSFTARPKKGSDDSTIKLMLSVPTITDEHSNNNQPSELTPLKNNCPDYVDERATINVNGLSMA